MIRAAVVPVYLLLCLCLGGASAGGFAANCLLQLIALPMIAWSLLVRRDDPLSTPARSLLTLTLLLTAIMALQLVPLPPALWTRLPGRGPIADGYRLLGAPLPWLPLALAPQAAMASALWLLAPAAVLLGIIRLGAFRPSWIAGAVITGAILSVLLGAAQVLGGANSPLYFYRFTNWGQAVGFFANGNHLATLLVASIPFGAALQAHWLSKVESKRTVPVVLVVSWALLLVIGVGLVINTSLAGLALGLTAAIASAFLIRASRPHQVAIGTGVTGLLLIGAVAAVFLGPAGGKLTDTNPGNWQLEQLTRRVSISKTVHASTHYLPVGAGSGAFRQIYQQTEDPRKTTGTFMNHAHSDVAEVLLETGVAGAVFFALLLAWWARQALAIWRYDSPDYYARASTIASGAIMAHSCVDYPLRTAAIAATFAACLALMAGSRPMSLAPHQSRRQRHLRLN